ncbi:MAG: hypothetical protein JXB06_15520 [Spirochaetales bacterium]|nr:hypothetical protein [Spirochaetales bacterium]
MPDTPTAQRAVARALKLLSGLPGIVAVKRVGRETVGRIVELESRYEQGALVPLKNLGVRAALKRDVAVGVLKDGRFREPPAPTVCLVEELHTGDCPAEHRLSVEGKSYRIIGEEVLASRSPYSEKIISLGESFVIFPDRRSSNKTPSYFLIPPLGFPELEELRQQLGIAGVLSISPSAQADTCLREACGFPPDPSLATLLVAFDLSSTTTP